jgi:D-alanyl-lipoteichoic acid acyltransferase DltB (MBOAT superfamily)
MIWQLAQKTDWRLKSWQLALGLSLFAMGLFKKSVLIDPQVPHIDVVFDQAAAGIAVSAFDGWVAALGYGFQIYFDFSAYSDMAIGLGFMFGLRLPVNFFSPYKADSFRDFWRRWHITLSRFLRDYLYIPLGGSWHGFPRTILALLVTMGLGGLWHGAGWTFVIWGLIHGVLLGANHVWDRAVRPRIPFLAQPRSPLASRIGRWVSVGVVYTVVNVAWVYFRAPDVAAAHVILAGMFGATDAPSISEMDGIAQMLPYYLAIVWLLPNTMQMFRRFEIALNADDYFDRSRPLVLDRLWAVRLGVRWAVISAIVFAVDWSFLSDMSPFIYFQF